MEELNGVTIYWLVSIGLVVGYVMDLIMSRGMGMAGNLAGGVVSSVIIGVFVIMMNFFAPLVYATLGSIAFLFLVNVFRIEPNHKQEAEVLKR